MADTDTQPQETSGDATENTETIVSEATEQATETPANTETSSETAQQTMEISAQTAETENTGDAAIGATTENVEAATETPEEPEEISYHTVEKEGHIGAIWEMQGRKHLRTIDPRSQEGKHILSLFTSEHHEEENAA